MDKKDKLIEFRKIRSYVNSSNVDRVMYDTDTEKLVVKFTDGSIYTYENIDEKTFEKIIDGVDVPKTSGKNKYGSWKAGVGPSVGATVYKKLVQAGKPYSKGGKFR